VSGPQIVIGILAVGAVALSALAYSGSRQYDKRLADIEGRIAQVAQTAAKLDGMLAQANQRRGPDPNKAYTVNTAGSPSRGDASAAVTIAEFSDFQCPFCSRVGPTLERVRQVYGDKVRVVWKHNPLPMHKDAPLAHLAAVAAAEQGKFWEYHDRLFANQQKLQRPFLSQYARELGLDVARFDRAVDSKAGQPKIDVDAAEGRSLGVSGTPAFFINGHFLNGAQPFEKFAEVINGELTRLGMPIPPGAAPAGG
jgi:protein-disulfide isomerase